MTIEEAIAQAHARTGKRAENIGIDANFELLTVIQDICSRARFPWRKKSLSFTSVIATATYDLTSTSIASLTDFEELISLYRFDTTTTYCGLGILDTDEEILAAIAASATTGDTTAYCNNPGGAECTVLLSPTPNAAKTYRGLYWAMPAALDSSSGAIPLIPARWHYVVVKLLEAAFLEALPKGIATEEALAKRAAGERGIEFMLAKTKFSTKEKRVWISPEDAIRSR